MLMAFLPGSDRAAELMLPRSLRKAVIQPVNVMAPIALPRNMDT